MRREAHHGSSLPLLSWTSPRLPTNTHPHVHIQIQDANIKPHLSSQNHNTHICAFSSLYLIKPANMPFPHKTVLITGATAGIGRALAERMVENGVFVIAVGRRKERLQELEAKYGRDKVVAEEFDMTKTAEIQAWAQR